MVRKNYKWAEGATIDEHSKRKHKILGEYFREYLITRCKNPKASKFRLAVVDGFSGAGIYGCGSYGSPLIFLDVLKNTAQEINIERVSNGMQPIEIECFLIFNDLETEAIEQLKVNIAPLLGEIEENHPKLHVKVLCHNKKFEEIYPEIKNILLSARYKSVLFNLDQCGYSHVNNAVMKDIMSSWNSAEIFLTFPIQTILTYLSPDENKNSVLTGNPILLKEINDLKQSDGTKISTPEWLGKAEAAVFENLKACAPFVSPFSINNPDGWRYWLIHFANIYRARQVYNNILHDNSATQAHFGRAGLNMLSYDPKYEGQLYLFDDSSREAAKKDLYDDIPKRISEFGDTIGVEDFYIDIYNGTAAHSDDIHEMIIENDDLEVITEAGGERRKANTIKPTDTLRLKQQKSLFPLFLNSVT